MEGLAVNVIKFSEVISDEDFRLESEYFNSENVKFKSVKGSVIESFSQYGTSNELNEENKGYPVLRLNEFDSFFISKPSKYCDLLSNEVFESLKLKKDDVLVCRTNGNPKYVGKAAIVGKDYDYAFASYVYRVRPDRNIINSATLVAFMNSTYGRNEIERYAMVGNQANFSPAKFRQISIPILGKKINDAIEKIIYQSFEYLEKSKYLYIQAEEQLLNELGLKNWKPQTSLFTIKKLNDFVGSGRLDAEFYQKKYDEIEHVITTYKGGHDSISKHFALNEEVCDYKEDKYKYIEIGDIKVFDGSYTYNTIETSNLPDNAKRVLHKDDILISKVRPNRGAITIIDIDTNDLIGSGAFTVLHEKTNYKKEIILLLFRTAIYKDWLLKWNVGTSYPVIKDEDILNLPIPLLPDSIQCKIADLLQQSIDSKKKSQDLINDAVNLVEKEIEKNVGNKK